VVVGVELTPQAPFDTLLPPHSDWGWLNRELVTQNLFALVRQWTFPDYGGVCVSLWKRTK
jgi:hypothetical protein